MYHNFTTFSEGKTGFLRDINKQNFILNTKVLIPIFIISISCIIYFTDSVKDRYSDFIKRIYIETQTTNIIHVIGNNRYGAHFDAALKIFKNSRKNS